MVAILNRMSIKGLTENLSFAHRLEKEEIAKPTLGSVSGRGNNLTKSPKAGTCLADLCNSKNASVPGVDCVRGRVIRMKS